MCASLLEPGEAQASSGPCAAVLRTSEEGPLRLRWWWLGTPERAQLLWCARCCRAGLKEQDLAARSVRCLYLPRTILNKAANSRGVKCDEFCVRLIVRLTKTNRIWGSLRSSNHQVIRENPASRGTKYRQRFLSVSKVSILTYLLTGEKDAREEKTTNGAPTCVRVRARLPPKNGFDTPPKYVFSPFSLYLQCILSAIHPLYLRHSDVLYRCVFSRYVVRYRSGIGLHAWCLHVLSIQYMRLYRRFSILNDTHRYMTSLSPLPRGCCACVSIQEAPSCPLV